MDRSNSIVMIGAPESGKTNYLARLWKAVQDGEGELRASHTSEDISYVIEALTYLLQGKFAPRTETGAEIERTCTIPVSWDRDGSTHEVELVVPDVSGELWKDAMTTNELATEWMECVRTSIGALLFIRALSPLNNPSLDLVTDRELLKLSGSPQAKSEDADLIPTDVQLCEFLRFLEFALSKDSDVVKPRVAIMVTAWDLLDNEREKRGPRSYVSEEFPLFSGRLHDIKSLDVEVFGVSVVGGDFIDRTFKEKFLSGNIEEFGFVATESGSCAPKNDIAFPVQWILDGALEQ